MTDVYIASARRSIRRSLFQRFKTMGLSQDQIVRAVATATNSALVQANVADLAALAASAGAVATALNAAAPGDPSLAAFQTTLNNSGTGIADLVDYVIP